MLSQKTFDRLVWVAWALVALVVFLVLLACSLRYVSVFPGAGPVTVDQSGGGDVEVPINRRSASGVVR